MFWAWEAVDRSYPTQLSVSHGKGPMAHSPLVCSQHLTVHSVTGDSLHLSCYLSPPTRQDVHPVTRDDSLHLSCYLSLRAGHVLHGHGFFLVSFIARPQIIPETQEKLVNICYVNHFFIEKEKHQEIEWYVFCYTGDRRTWTRGVFHGYFLRDQ